MRAQPCRHAIGSGQPIDRAAGQHHRIHRVHQIPGIERVGLARAGTAAAHIGGAGGAAFGQDHGDAGAHFGVVGLAHGEARHIGDQIARTWATFALRPGEAATAGQQRRATRQRSKQRATIHDHAPQ